MGVRKMMRAALLLLLTGCAIAGCADFKVRPAEHYTWRKTQEPMDYYRWVVLSGDQFPHVCGFYSFRNIDGKNGEAGCFARVAHGLLRPGDREIATGIAPDKLPPVGKLCIVFSTLTEDGANAITDKSGVTTLAQHEVGGHCRGGEHDEKF